MRIIIAFAFLASIPASNLTLTTPASALVSCTMTDQDTLKRKGLALDCLPEAVQAQHDAECLSFGLKRETDAYFICRVYLGDAYRNAKVLELMQDKTAEDVNQ